MRYLLLLACALALAPSAGAQTGTAYYGLALGSFDYQEDDIFGSPLFGDTGSSYRLMVGYFFNDHLAVEGGYGASGKLRDSGTVDFIGGPTDINFSSDFKIFTVRLLGVLPFDNGITLLGGLGYANMKQDFTYEFVGFGSQSGDVSGGEATYFAGVQYDWDRVAVRLAYEKYDFGSGVDVSETSIAFFYKL